MPESNNSTVEVVEVQAIPLDGSVVPEAKQAEALSRREDLNKNWVAVAEEVGIPLWEQQPNETVDEFDMWTTYRDLWPTVRPTITKVAQALRVSPNKVMKASRKWTWSARLQAWIREVNAEHTAELRQARRKMVEDQIAIGEKLRSKMLKAVENLDEYDITPGELVQLLKVTQSFEDTARESLDAVERETAADVDSTDLFVPDDQAAQPSNSRGISAEDAAEVVKILQTAGVLSMPGTKVGVRQTTTTEVVAENEL